MKKLRDILLYAWQLPQNIAGVVTRMIYKGNDYNVTFVNKLGKEVNVIVRKSDKIRGGVSLGKYIVINQKFGATTILHEIGHCKQSLILGPLYLLVIGIPSGIHNLIDRKYNLPYYDFYTEKWADKLVGITRK